MIKVFISSPYSKGDVCLNVKMSMAIGNQLIEKGYAPFIPLLSHFQNMVFYQSYEKWMELDFEWIKSCDCLLRIQGESSGADREEKFAHDIGKRVFYNIQDIDEYYKSEWIIHEK